MSRFFVSPEQIGGRMITIEDRNDLHHMKKVLRLKPGDEVDISDSQQWEYHAKIIELNDEIATLQILDRQSFAAEPRTRITLYQGIPKQGKMETIVQKTVELGVFRIVPVFMERTVVVDKGNFARKIDRWNKVSAEAVKQCRRGIVPEVSPAIRMPQALEELQQCGYDLILIPYEDERGTTIKEVLREYTGADAPAEAGNVAVLIGPEGGFSEAEVAAVTGAGGRSVSLGRTTLRTETAGMAAIAMIMYELEL